MRRAMITAGVSLGGSFGVLVAALGVVVAYSTWADVTGYGVPSAWLVFATAMALLAIAVGGVAGAVGAYRVAGRYGGSPDIALMLPVVATLAVVTYGALMLTVVNDCSFGFTFPIAGGAYCD